MNRQEARRRISKIVPVLRKDLDIDKGPPWNRVGAFQCLIGTVLSARTRDENTSRAARSLFAKYPDAHSLARAPVRNIEGLIRPSGFYRVKARRIRGLAGFLLRHHNGRVPDDMDGEVLKGLFDKNSEAYAREVKYRPGEGLIDREAHVMDKEERKEMEKSLRALGYID